MAYFFLISGAIIHSPITTLSLFNFPTSIIIVKLKQKKKPLKRLFFYLIKCTLFSVDTNAHFSFKHFIGQAFLFQFTRLIEFVFNYTFPVVLLENTDRELWRDTSLLEYILLLCPVQTAKNSENRKN